MICPRCGTKNKNSSAKCVGCGLRISASPDGSVKGPGDVDTISLLSEHPELAGGAAEQSETDAAVNKRFGSDQEEYSAPRIVYKREHKAVHTILSIVFAFVLAVGGFFIGTLVGDSDQFDMRGSLERAERMVIEGNFGIAQEEYNKVLAADPKNVEAIIGSAECLKAKGDTEGAAAVLEKGISLTKSKIIEVYANDPDLL